ncbi:MAG TPA: serine hydrolase domain-containing protein [Thermoanaerobaculia bacterium]|nr:serine hydrolase domain-containing protein [Thermoanaerobaculia bacterium]
MARAGAAGTLDDFLRRLLREQRVSAAVALVARGDLLLWRGAAGLARRRPAVPVGARHRFDYASLTKPFMATLALALDRRGLLPLDRPLGEIYPEADRRLARQPLSNLLRHRSGLRPWTPFYARCRGRTEAERLLIGGALLDGRPGTYGDLDFALWGFAAERALGLGLDAALARHVARPLGLRGVSAEPPSGEAVECRLGNDREVELAAAQGIAIARRAPTLRGRPQDGNVRFLGRLGGHAGLFGRAGDLWRLGREWLTPQRLLTRRAVDDALAGSGEYALCWARRRVRGSAGPALGRGAFGHTGFTGGSLWIDPESGGIFVLLAHRRSALDDFSAARREFHRLAAREFFA